MRLFNLGKNKQSYHALHNKALNFAKDFTSNSNFELEGNRAIDLEFVKHTLTAPIVWLGIIPAVFMDAFVSAFQRLSFPVYKMQQVKRSDFIVFDREHLKYLKWNEKINCWYCSYFNGVAAYTQEVAARTERYWCPLKHQITPKTPHRLYQHFAEYGDAKAFRRKYIEQVRKDL